MGDSVNHPPHYNKGPTECIDYVEQVCGFYFGDEATNIGEVIKYVTRAPHKGNKAQDLRKALWYLTRAIEVVERKERAYHEERNLAAAAATAESSRTGDKKRSGRGRSRKA